MTTTTSSRIFSAAHPVVQEEPVDWEQERERAFAFFELDWDSTAELPFTDIGDPNVNDRCMAEALAFCEVNHIKPELWGLLAFT